MSNDPEGRRMHIDREEPVYKMMCRDGGATCEEVARALNISMPAALGRMRRIRNSKFIKIKTRSRSFQIVEDTYKPEPPKDFA
jgi:Mn-dependent DtxR family transcriptional regulator